MISRIVMTLLLFTTNSWATDTGICKSIIQTNTDTALKAISTANQINRIQFCLSNNFCRGYANQTTNYTYSNKTPIPPPKTNNFYPAPEKKANTQKPESYSLNFDCPTMLRKALGFAQSQAPLKPATPVKKTKATPQTKKNTFDSSQGFGAPQDFNN